MGNNNSAAPKQPSNGFLQSVTGAVWRQPDQDLPDGDSNNELSQVAGNRSDSVKPICV